ncbi:nucleotidyltransferase family protein [Neobacillus mesonae]|uniref:nucleotidyltransferase domain-containing protein n=1 Tax=Neobacillus mesonae TaxID=1193713 RepID=UPI00203F34A6|nr:nucleotidyltransferase family protein [Neobacillus mesonae]MCM3568205.1 nucleotidyltransferase family protein [Neobacillus mesonae]
MDHNFSLDLKTVPNELKFLLEILRNKNREVIETLLLGEYQKINWDLFLKLAVHHRIYPIIYSRLKQFNCELIPSYIIQSLFQLYKKNTFQMLFLCSEMEQINNMCSENQIPVIFLKGPILAYELYGDISLRTSVDLDIIIPIKDLKKMEDLLINYGFEKDDYIETVLNDWKWRHHHITFYHPKKGIKMEVHWRLNPGPGSEPSFNKLWERRKRSTITTNPIFFLGVEDLFLFLVTHGSRHGWSRLRWLVDIDRIVKSKPDWNKAYIHLKHYHYQHIGGQSLLLAAALLKTPLNKNVIPFIRGNKPGRLAQEAVFYFRKMVNLHTNPVPLDVSNYHKHHLFSLMSIQQRTFFILSFLYPYPDDAKTLPLPKLLHFLYFPLRPLLWVWRKSKSHAFQ